MTILSDKQIAAHGESMVYPFLGGQVSEGCISYGLSSYGYDIRLANGIKLFTHDYKCTPIDPKNFDPELLREVIGPGPYVIPAYGYALGVSVETFSIPDDVFVIFLGKSTYARAGLVVNVTPAEPGWKGELTIEMANTTPQPLLIYPGEGISQAVFFKGEKPKTTYGDKLGKYQFQKGITLPFVEE